MATIKLSALAAIAAASISATDILPMTDSDAGTPTTYKVSMAQMRTAILQASVGAGWGATDYLGLGAGTIPTTGMVRAGQGAITADTPLINSTATWNNVAITFRHLLVNITDTTSAAASLFADFQIAGSSKWSVTKAGAVTQAAGLTVTAGGLTVSAGTTAVQALTVAGASIFATSMRFDGNAVKFRFHNSGFEDWDVGTLTSSTSFSIGSATLADVLTIGNAGGASLKGALTVTSGGIGVTGASTITGTLGGITTLTVNTLATTTSTAITFNNNGNNDVWLNAAGASFRILSNGGAGQLLSVSQAGALTVASGLTVTTGGISASGQTITATTFSGALSGNASTASAVAASGVTGTTLASNVVTSSLTSVGILASPHMTSAVVDSGGLTVTAGATSVQALSVAGTITLFASTSKILMGSAALIVRDSTDTNDNLNLSASGNLTLRGNLVLSGAAASGGVGTVGFGSTTASTVGAAGGASALPATPLGYLVANVGGSQVKVPYYNN